MHVRTFNQHLFDQYKEQGECCIYCGDNTPFELITRDHFYPVSKGFTLQNNKIFSCRRCNSTKGNMDLDQFKETVLNLIYKTLRSIINNNWKVCSKQHQTIRWCSRVLKNLSKLKETPPKLFT
jgi:5-methylcytosine-specific restriction endonuclease McrA